MDDNDKIYLIALKQTVCGRTCF